MILQTKNIITLRKNFRILSLIKIWLRYVIIPKLLKLKPEEILYVTKKYTKAADITNPESYVLTMLYGAIGMPVAKTKKTSYNLNDLLAKSGLYIE